VQLLSCHHKYIGVFLIVMLGLLDKDKASECFEGFRVLQGFEPGDTWFQISVRVAREIMKSHIISSASDKMAVIFYGTVDPTWVPQ
jgi:hypothetical protein